MASHSWGDGWEGWKTLGKAEKTLYFWGNKVGRIGGQMKEKYGEIRWYAGLGKIERLHDIVKHGHVAYRWSPDDHFFMSWLDNLSIAYIAPFWRLSHKYQCFMYGFAYHMACKKYPLLKSEILGCVDYQEFLFKSERDFLVEEAAWKAIQLEENEDEQT